MPEDPTKTVDLDQEIGVDGLTVEQRSQLSKALFPESDITFVEIAGKKREFKPLPVKYSREISARLEPFNAVLKAQVKDPNTDTEMTDNELADHLVACARTICVRHGWEDLIQLLDEEELVVEDIQSIVVTQTNVQSKNDFLLKPLRVLVALLRHQEITAVSTLQSMSFGLDK